MYIAVQFLDTGEVVVYMASNAMMNFINNIAAQPQTNIKFHQAAIS